ncbi:hypothetical protein BB558_005905 [Smittium angustum]|uniref:Uncharacterized protein n=1 Tax=Smittium angustum TaxID=133377 RepID=A0A2U1IZ93_SMIAN|nr:hypothetical protein BB558_005905 [Smittium angustum]
MKVLIKSSELASFLVKKTNNNLDEIKTLVQNKFEEACNSKAFISSLLYQTELNGLDYTTDEATRFYNYILIIAISKGFNEIVDKLLQLTKLVECKKIAYEDNTESSENSRSYSENDDIDNGTLYKIVPVININGIFSIKDGSIPRFKDKKNP